jgi:hypothetical protein
MLNVARFAWLNQQNNLPAGVLLYTVPIGGFGVYVCYGSLSVLQKATTSGTVPNLGAICSMTVDGVANVALVIINAYTGNVLNYSQGSIPPSIFLPDGATITLNSAGYVSVGASPLIYNMRLAIAYVGPYQ